MVKALLTKGADPNMGESRDSSWMRFGAPCPFCVEVVLGYASLVLGYDICNDLVLRSWLAC